MLLLFHYFTFKHVWNFTYFLFHENLTSSILDRSSIGILTVGCLYITHENLENYRKQIHLKELIRLRQIKQLLERSSRLDVALKMS